MTERRWNGSVWLHLRRVNVGRPNRSIPLPRVRTVLHSTIVLAAVACAGGTLGSQVPTPINGFRPEDRVLIGDFTRVNALAATTDRVYVVYPTAVAIWKPLERRWEVPRSPRRPEDLRGVTSAVVDPLDRTLWLATGAAWIHYDPLANRWDEGPFAVPPARWPRFGTTVDDAMRDLPQLRALAPVIATGPSPVRGTLTAAARDPLGNGWFLGTSVRGLVFFDRMATDVQPMSLGLRGDVVGAIAVTPDGIWVATDNDGFHPAGITELTTDLDASSPIGANAVRGLPFNFVRRILPTSSGAWLATDKGAVRVLRDADQVQRFGVTNGLGDERVLTLVQHRGRIYAGTMRGLAQSLGDTGFVSIARPFGDPVYSLLSVGDTLWVGTAQGLYGLLPSNDELRMTEGFRLIAGTTGAIVAIGTIADTLVAMTPSQLFWRDPVSGGWSAGPDLGRQLGALIAFEPTARGAWVGGARGAAFVGATGVALQFVLAPDQLPDELTSIAAAGRYLWIGTRAGLVRFLLTNR